jgi:hypothetical protein
MTKIENILTRAKDLMTQHNIKLSEALHLMHIEHSMLPVWKRVWLWFFGE